MKQTVKVVSLKRHPYIDALRGWAIIGVLLAHVSIVGSVIYPSWLYKITYIYVAPRGVQLFFVVSAFTLCLSWYNRKKEEKHALLNFYIRRFFRIAPLFYVVLLYFLYIQNYWSGNPNHFSLPNILATIFFLNGFFPAWLNNIVYGGWTIAVEMTFYLCFPLLVSYIKSIRTSLFVLLLAMILMQGLRLYLNTLSLFHATFSTFTFEFFPSQLPVFLIGIVVFLCLNSPWTLLDRKVFKLSLVVFAFALFAQFLFHVPLIAGHYLYGIFFGLLLVFLTKYPTKLLVNPITTHIGKVSYSMYLSHVAILYILDRIGFIHLFSTFPILHFFYVFFLLLLVTTGVSTVLFHIIERPGQLIGKKLIDAHEKVATLDINSSLKTW